MRKFSAIVIFCFCLPAYAISTCTDIIQQMDIHTKTKDAQAKTYPWVDFSWITTVLGDAQVTPIVEKQYSWGQYNLIVRNGQVFDERGPKPKALEQYKFAPTLDQATAVLGKPQKENEANLSEYRWACTDTSSMLDVIASNDSKIVSSSFFYCDSLKESNCSYGHLA